MLFISVVDRFKVKKALSKKKSTAPCILFKWSVIFTAFALSIKDTKNMFSQASCIVNRGLHFVFLHFPQNTVYILLCFYCHLLSFIIVSCRLFFSVTPCAKLTWYHIVSDNSFYFKTCIRPQKCTCFCCMLLDMQKPKCLIKFITFQKQFLQDFMCGEQHFS